MAVSTGIETNETTVQDLHSYADAHGDPEEWTELDIEVYLHLAEITPHPTS